MNKKAMFDALDSVRDFNTDKYVSEKVMAINDFFGNYKLDAVVVGISGGVDSAVVLGLLHLASTRAFSPIKKVLPITIPMMYSPGVTGQSDSCLMAFEVMKKFEYDMYSVDISSASQWIESTSQMGDSKDSWAIGQMNSVLRTPVLYYHAAILQSKGFKSLVCGTINRDEGSYIGYYGKASDAMVDMQIIADIHKDEVYKVAEFLGIPEKIMKREPKGDVWDGKTDEEMIGVPYDFLKYFILAKEHECFRSFAKACWREQEWIDKIESLNTINHHKYQVGMPSHFIDVMPRKVPGGWQ